MYSKAVICYLVEGMGRVNWQEQPKLLVGLSVVWLVVINGVAFLWHLGSTGLVDETEPLFAEAARLMLVKGDWVTPYWNGETRFDKPALVYWLMAFCYKLLGINEWGARLPSAFSAIALVVFLFYVLRCYGCTHDNRSPKQLWLGAYIGSGLLALNPQTIAWARVGVSDMLLSACIGGSLLAFFMGYVQSQQPEHQRATAWYMAFYGLMGLGVLTKGPVAVVLPGLTILAFTLYFGNTGRVWRESLPLRGWLLFAVITLPWYLAITVAQGWNFINAFFGYHNVERFTAVVNRHWAPWYFYFVVVALGAFPVSVYLPQAIARLQVHRRSWWLRSPRSQHLGIFALIWFLVVFGFFSIATTKLPSYVLPLMPAVAILLALLWSDPPVKSTPRPLLASSIGNLIILLAAAAASYWAVSWIGLDPMAPQLKEALQASGLPVAGMWFWLASAIAVGVCIWLRQEWWAWSVNTTALLLAVVMLLTPAKEIYDQQRQLPLRQLSMVVNQLRRPNEELIMIGDTKPSVVFYTQNRVKYLWAAQQVLPHLGETMRVELGRESALIIATRDNLRATGLKGRNWDTLGRGGPYRLVRVSIAKINQ